MSNNQIKMKLKISEKVSKILTEADLISAEEKQSLFWHLLEKFGKEHIFTYQYLTITDSPTYFLSFNMIDNIIKTRNLGTWKNKITYISPDFNEPLDDLSDYM